MVSDIIGAQAHTWDKLSSISRSKKIGSAYLFSGPVGSGKEGLALKFAQLINCKSGSSEFCNGCDSCLKFKSSESYISSSKSVSYTHLTLPTKRIV